MWSQGIEFVEVSEFGAMAQVADRLNAGERVGLWLGGCDKAQARRCIDFASGAAYITGASLSPVKGAAYLLLPPGDRLSPKAIGKLAEALPDVE